MAKEAVEESIPIKSLMSKKVVSCPKEAPLQDVVKNIAQKVISCVIIVDEEKKPIGILSERDLISRIIAKGKTMNDLPLSDVMTAPVHAVTEDADLLVVSKLMREKGVRHFPVINKKGVLVGLVTETDVFGGLIHHVKHLNWSLVEREIRKDRFKKILTEIKRHSTE